MQRDRLRAKQSIVKTIVLLFIERTVEVVVSALSIARRAKRDFTIDSLRIDDR